MYAQSLQQVHESQAEQIQALTRNQGSMSQEQQENIESEFEAVCSVAKSLKPGPVDNFDLVDTSEAYKKKLEGLMKQNF